MTDISLVITRSRCYTDNDQKLLTVVTETSKFFIWWRIVLCIIRATIVIKNVIFTFPSILGAQAQSQGEFHVFDQSKPAPRQLQPDNIA